MLEVITFVIGFEGIVLAAVTSLWCMEWFAKIKGFLIPFSSCAGLLSLVVYYYLKDDRELMIVCAIFGCIFLGIAIYAMCRRKNTHVKEIDIPQNSYQIVMDDFSSTAESQPIHKLIYDGEVYVIATPVENTKPALKLLVFENQKSGEQSTQVIIKGKPQRTPGQKIKWMCYMMFNILALGAPFICLWMHDTVKTAKYVIFLIFGHGTCLFQDAGSVYHKMVYYIGLLVSIVMFLGIFFE